MALRFTSARIDGKRRFEKKETCNLARYIGMYIRHPPIAEYRITAYDGKQVTFWYESPSYTVK